MSKFKWPNHCRTCQYRSGYNGAVRTCNYMLTTGKSLIKEYGFYGGDPQVIRDMCTHYRDEKDIRLDPLYRLSDSQSKKIRKEAVRKKKTPEQVAEAQRRREEKQQARARERELARAQAQEAKHKKATETADRIRKLTDAGWSINAIAAELGVSRTTVYKKASAFGISLNHELAEMHDHQEYVELFDRGLSNQEVAALLGVAMRTVTNQKTKYNKAKQKAG